MGGHAQSSVPPAKAIPIEDRPASSAPQIAPVMVWPRWCVRSAVVPQLPRFVQALRAGAVLGGPSRVATETPQ